MECQTGGVCHSPPDAVGRFNQMLSRYLQKLQDVDTEASLNALFVWNARLVLAS